MPLTPTIHYLKNNRSLLVFLILLLVINISFAFYRSAKVEPRLAKSLAQLQSGTTTQQKILEEQQPDQAYQKKYGELQQFFASVPLADNLPELVTDLYNLSRKSGISLNNISYAPKQISELEYLQYDIKFSVDGSYRQIKHFLHVIEQSPRLWAIGGIVLNGKEMNHHRSIHLDIALSTWFRTVNK